MMVKRALLALFAALLCGLPAEAKEKITFAYLLDPSYDAIVWPLKTGKVTSDLIDVEMKSLDIPALLQITGAKSFDVVMTAAIGVPVAKSRGLDLVIMAAALRNIVHGKSSGIFVKADSPFHEVTDLKGKTMGNYSLPSTGTTLMRIGLWKKYGINVAYEGGDMKWVEIPASALPGALLTNRIDAATLAHSEAYLADRSKDFRLLAQLNDAIDDAVGAPGVSAVLASYPDKLAARPAEFKEFARVIKASSDYTRAHVAEVAAAVGAESKMPPAFFDTWLNEYFEAPMVLSDGDMTAISNLWRLSKELGVIKSYPELKDVVWQDALRH
jgi:NitT/TauT family transport system substrate-binding protein